jgi:molybdopterin molybdotransferase
MAASNDQQELRQDIRITVAEARFRLLSAVAPVGAWESVATRDALGRVLARPVVAPFDVPANDNSAMDGYAVRVADLAGGEATLAVVGSALAGRHFSGVVGPGQAVRVGTGAIVPVGADTVVMRENVQQSGENTIRVPAGQTVVGQHIRRAGEDLARGKPALPTGKRMGPAELGVLASLGIAEVQVYRRPRVAFLSTGDELCAVGRPLGPGEVYDSNRYALFGALSVLGVDVLDMGVVREDPAAIERAFRAASENADVVITTGGSSIGSADSVRDILGRLGEVNYWRLDLKPGRPVGFGRIGQAWLFALPGNPVAVMVSYYQFVIDALLKLMGVDPIPVRPIFRVPCADTIRKQPGRREFPRGLLFVDNGEWRVKLAGNQGSGVLRSMSEANCFIVLDEGQGSVDAGDLVAVQMFEGLF